jgi:hypothetical protein
MKEFMLLIRNEIDHQSTWTDVQHDEFLQKCRDYIQDLKDQHALISAQPLVREGTMISRPGEQWKDGPFSESKEVIVGYYHILAENIEGAVAIAKRNPEFEYGFTARIEVRPVKTREERTQFVYPKVP